MARRKVETLLDGECHTGGYKGTAMEDDDFLLNTLSSGSRKDQTRVNFMEESLMSSSSPFGGGSRDTVKTNRSSGTPGRSRTPGRPPRTSVLDSSRRATPGEAYTPSRNVHFAGLSDSPAAARMPGSGYSYFNTPSSYGSAHRQGTPKTNDGLRRGPGNTPYARGGGLGSSVSSDSQARSPMGPSGILGGLDDEDAGSGYRRDDNGFTSYGHSGGKSGPGRDSFGRAGGGRSPFGRTTRGGLGLSDSSFHDEGKMPGNVSFTSRGVSGQEANLYSSGHNLLHPGGSGSGDSASSHAGIRGGDGGGNQGMLSVDDICRCWLIVSGFYPDNHRAERVMELLNSRGSVLSIRESTGNWVLLRFPSAREAVRVQQQNDGKMLSNGMVVGVRQLDAHMAQNMHLRLSSDGTFIGGSGSGSGGVYDGILTGTDYRPGQQAGTAPSLSSNAPEGRVIDPTEDLWGSGESAKAGLSPSIADPEYVSGGSSLRSRHPSRGKIRAQDNGTPQNIQLRGSRVEIAGPVSPSQYLRPIKRDSVCELVMKYFGFR